MKAIIAASLLALAGCASTPAGSSEHLEPASRVWRVTKVSTGSRACGLPYAQQRQQDGRWRVLFLTARHFTEGLDTSSRYTAAHPGTARFLVNGRELSVHGSKDAAVLTFLSSRPVPLVTLSYRAPRFGEVVYVAGYGGGGGALWLAQGLVSGPDRCTAPIYFGDSGGAVINQSGRVLGIIVSMEASLYGPISHHCRLVPLHHVRRWLPRP